LGSLLFGSLPASASTVAYWRFEDGPADALMTHVSGVDGTWSADVADSAGNGNALSVWSTGGGGGYIYKSDVPSATIPQTGTANNFSVKNSGGGPAMWCNTLRTWAPAAFTIEASFKPESGGYRTIVGRDSRGAGTQGGADAAASALYFQIRPDNSVAIIFEDVSGYQYSAGSAAGLIQGFDYSTDPDGLNGRWYSMAGVSDGATLSLYLNDLAAGTGYQLVAQTDMRLKGSPNTAFTPGIGSAGDWTAGDFSVGRGLYNGGHGDRAYGFIDEVRLSDTALTSNQFLSSSVGEPVLQGIVTDSLSGNPVTGAAVKVGTRSTATDSSGHYTLTNSAGVALPMSVTDAYGETSYTSTVTLSTSGPVTRNVSIAIRPHIFLSTGNGYAWKAILNTGDAADYSAVSADETGMVPYTVPGSWDSISAINDIYGWIRVHFTLPANFTTAIPGRAVRFHISGGGIDDVNKTYLNGTLIGSAGSFPNPGLSVQPADHLNPPTGQTYTTTWPGLDPSYGEELLYTFPASLLTAGDNVVAIKCFDWTAGGGVFGNVTLEVIGATGAVTGTITAGGSPVASARVAVSDAAGNSNAWGWTDANGAFSLPFATAGSGVLGVTKLGFDSIIRPVMVPTNGTLHLNLTTTTIAAPYGAPLYDNFDDNAGAPTWQNKWWPVALENNSDPLNTPSVAQPGYDVSSGGLVTIPSTATVYQNANGHRSAIVSKDRFSRFASVNEAKLVSAKGPAAGSTDDWGWNTILHLNGNPVVDPTVPTPNIFNPEVELDLEGWLSNGTENRVQWIVWDSAGRRSSGVVPMSLLQMADVTPANPIILDINRTGSVYDFFINGTLVHSELGRTPMMDHRIAMYGYQLVAQNTWDWVAGGPIASAAPIKGDVNANAVLDFSDVVDSLRIAGGLSTSISAQITAGNQAGGDAIISVLDAVRIDQALGGKAL
jgi:hypothetical protein